MGDEQALVQLIGEALGVGVLVEQSREVHTRQVAWNWDARQGAQSWKHVNQTDVAVASQAEGPVASHLETLRQDWGGELAGALHSIGSERAAGAM